jgi:hypothetical protein
LTFLEELARNKFLKMRNEMEEKTIRLAENRFRGNSFTLNIYDEWKDKTIYTIAGPSSDEMAHNILVTMDNESGFDNTYDYADWQIESLVSNLPACMLLKQGKKMLDCGIPAYEAVFRWLPIDEKKIYQQQIYVVYDKTGYTLTASFSKKTKKIYGPMVQRMMLSFNPQITKNIK